VASHSHGYGLAYQMAGNARNNRIIKKLKGIYASVGTAASTFASNIVYTGRSTA
jgi:hypothetical protein